MTEIPLSLVAPVRLAPDTANGFLLPHKKSDPPFLAFRWEGQPHLLRLGPPDTFFYYPIKQGYSATGTMISDTEFIVDLDSRYDATHESDPLGALVLADGKLSVVAIRAGDTFGDPGEIPLWGEFQKGSKEQKVGFGRWRIVAQHGDEQISLWDFPKDKQKAKAD
jgi:hypothetical protein